MALERRIGASERNFSEAHEKKFDKRDGGAGENSRVYERSAGTPQN